MIEIIVSLILLLFFVIVLHEWGHVVAFKELDRTVNVRFVKGTFIVGSPKDYEGLTKDQLRRIYEKGFVFGLLPILGASMLVQPIFILVYIPYLCWSWSDIKQIWRLRH